MYEIIKSEKNKEISLKKLAKLMLDIREIDELGESENNMKYEMICLQSKIKYDTRIKKKYVQISPGVIETIYYINEND